jgi:hypothetical protein
MKKRIEKRDKMKNLKSCQAYGIAKDWTEQNKLFKCSATDYCKHKRDFGGQKYCSDKVLPEPIMKTEKKENRV